MIIRNLDSSIPTPDSRDPCFFQQMAATPQSTPPPNYRFQVLELVYGHWLSKAAMTFAELRIAGSWSLIGFIRDMITLGIIGPYHNI